MFITRYKFSIVYWKKFFILFRADVHLLLFKEIRILQRNQKIQYSYFVYVSFVVTASIIWKATYFCWKSFFLFDFVEFKTFLECMIFTQKNPYPLLGKFDSFRIILVENINQSLDIFVKKNWHVSILFVYILIYLPVGYVQ